ncbi:hypothetical protein M5X06_00190 [Paenibacillus alvei]|uniref:HTH cro/C1-type domain-containing protein n=1 Tax=Paenibacillus alvei TaxID=44250 RepID=A0ABT4GVC4_PAEAL|nr:hypothetical protein [Paenibacillus alvei]MCY9760640.1 hypothetical protein [Paenibacillus alvei]MCY9765254.1 hypothetical protein [Paenibacillus alvei]NEZ44363.1 hypothetical protein [Paenibacillus alvei]
MIEVITKENTKEAVWDIEENVIIRNLRYAVYECMKIKDLTVQNIADSIGVNPDNIDRFLKADPELNGELPKRICILLNLDQNDYLPGYFVPYN